MSALLGEGRGFPFARRSAFRFVSILLYGNTSYSLLALQLAKAETYNMGRHPGGVVHYDLGGAAIRFVAFSAPRILAARNNYFISYICDE